MEAVIGKDITIEDPTPELMDWVRDNLIVTNPEYVSKKRMGLWLGNTEKELFLYAKSGNKLILPVGCYAQLPVRLKFKVDFPKFTSFPAPKMSLYSYQQAAVSKMIDKHFGILKAPCGSGKTQMGLWLAGNAGKVLWLTHTKDLLKQSYDRAKLFYDEAELGSITEGKVNIGSRITFATVQTLVKLDLSAYRYTWNTVIVDECQHAAGSPTKMMMFYKVLSNLSASRKYGLSATVHRADGMIKSLYAIIGPVLAEVSDEDVKETTAPVRVYRMDTGIPISETALDTDGTLIYSKLLNYLAGNEQRNLWICRHIYAKYKEHSNLCLSDRLEQLKTLRDMLPGFGVAASDIRYIDAKTKASDRDAALSDMRSGKAKVLLASYGLAKEGLDIPNLDRVHLLTPQKDYAVVLQSAGRVARVFPGKDHGLVCDYVDDIGFCVNAYKKRKKYYKEKGYEIIE